MKIKFKDFLIEIEFLLFIVIFISIFSLKVRENLKYFYLCYMFIIFHEMAHIFVANIFGKELEKINFCLSGVNVKFYNEKYNLTKNKNFLNEILIYLAGPISNIILALLFKNIEVVFDINIFLGIINLIPIYPLDGYNILCILIGKNKFLKNVKIKYISNIFFIFFVVLAIFEIIFLKSFSIIIFIVYLYIINVEKNKNMYYKIEKSCQKNM